MRAWPTTLQAMQTQIRMIQQYKKEAAQKEIGTAFVGTALVTPSVLRNFFAREAEVCFVRAVLLYPFHKMQMDSVFYREAAVKAILKNGVSLLHKHNQIVLAMCWRKLCVSTAT